MLSKNVLRRLEVLEKKLAGCTQDLEENKRLDEVMRLLQVYEFLCNQEKMSLTEEEIKNNDEKSSKQIIEWYRTYLALSPDEQKRQLEIQDKETAKVIVNFRE